MKILLMCGAGASSGFMAQAMRKAAKAQNMEDIEIIARSDAEMMNNLKGTDLIMFGPHLEYKKDALENDLKQYHIPFTFIDRDAYGSIDGEATLKQTLAVLKEQKVETGSVEEKKETDAAHAEKNTAKENGPCDRLNRRLCRHIRRNVPAAYLRAQIPARPKNPRRS